KRPTSHESGKHKNPEAHSSARVTAMEAKISAHHEDAGGDQADKQSDENQRGDFFPGGLLIGLRARGLVPGIDEIEVDGFAKVGSGFDAFRDSSRTRQSA